MGAPGETTDTIYRGDDYSHTVTLQDSAGDAYDASSSTWAAKLRATEDDATVLATLSIDTTNAATGILVCSIADTTTDDLTGSRAVWDLEETTSGGTVTTWLKVKCAIGRDVTRS